MNKNYKTAHWDEENKIATVTLVENGNVFVGIAKCNEIDADMCSEKTGMDIATQRVAIQYLCHIRDNELIPALRAVKQIYYSINRSKQFSPRSYETKTLYRAINRYEADLEAIRDEIKERRIMLRDYIERKDNFYNQVRAVRKKQALFNADKTE